MKKNRTQIVVCGAGPVGLLSALKFLKAGLEVTLIDAAETVNDSPRACAYLPATLEAFDTIGILDDVAKLAFHGTTIGRQVPALNYYGEVNFAGLDLGPYGHFLFIGQEEVAAILMRHLQSFPKFEMRWNTRLTGFAQREDGITIETEVNGEPLQIECEWLIGADGARSTVRSIAGIEFEGHTWPERFFATNVTYDFSKLGMTTGGFRSDPYSWAVIVRVNAKGVWRIAFGEDGSLPEESWRERIPGRLSDFIPQGEDYQLLRASPYRVHQRAGKSLRVGRVLLAGDAAHVTNPIGGLGLTTGFWDAMILGDVLPAVIAGEVSDAALDRYSDARRKVFWEFTSPTATENRRMLQERDPARQQADQAGFEALQASPEIQAQLMRLSYGMIGDPVIEKSYWRKYWTNAPH